MTTSEPVAVSSVQPPVTVAEDWSVPVNVIVIVPFAARAREMVGVG